MESATAPTQKAQANAHLDAPTSSESSGKNSPSPVSSTPQTSVDVSPLEGMANPIKEADLLNLKDADFKLKKGGVSTSFDTFNEDTITLTNTKGTKLEVSLNANGEMKNVTAQDSKLLDTNGNEFLIPDFTAGQIRAAIPKECFVRSTPMGMAFVARDLAQIAILFWVFHKYVTPEYVPNTLGRVALWFLYSIVQGLSGTGIWVLAHECGHQSFSPSKTVNDTVGFILHTLLLVPYFSWKISHGKHHRNTGHIERDMVFVPLTREKYASKVKKLAHEIHELTEEAPINTAISLFGQQLVGWLMYLIANTTGHNNHDRQFEGRGHGKRNGFGGGVNHYLASSPLYEAKDARLIWISDLGLLCVLVGLFALGHYFGFSNMLVWYGLPYLWVNHWLVAITYLQHTDPTLPHYSAETWTYARGAAATIDRDFGWIGKFFFHGIIETHVLHHYVSTIPFYNADKATGAIQTVMGRHYRADTKGGIIGFLKAMWSCSRTCQWVEPSEGAKDEGKGVLFYRNRNNRGLQGAKMAAPKET